MLFLQFQLAQDRYVLDSKELIEVLPLLDIKRIPKAPDGVVGAFNYRGVPTPVVDLSMLALGNSASLRMSTRILMVNFADSTGLLRPLGVIAEKVTDTLNIDPQAFADAGIVNQQARYLGPVYADNKGLIQWVKLAELLPQSVLDVLFKNADKAFKITSNPDEVIN